MIIKGIVDEDVVNYKKPSMYIAFPKCDFKCAREFGSICQNKEIIDEPDINISAKNLIKRYLDNSLTSAVIISGLEPFMNFEQLLEFIDEFRTVCEDDIVIFTGYTEEELVIELDILSKYRNVIIKFGRFIQGRDPVYNEILGVMLASDNQTAKYIKLTTLVNPDIKKAAEVKAAINENDGYCPCSPIKADETKCMCKTFRDQNTPGYCHCGLYFKI